MKILEYLSVFYMKISKELSFTVILLTLLWPGERQVHPYGFAKPRVPRGCRSLEKSTLLGKIRVPCVWLARSSYVSGSMGLQLVTS